MLQQEVSIEQLEHEFNIEFIVQLIITVIFICFCVYGCYMDITGQLPIITPRC